MFCIRSKPGIAGTRRRDADRSWPVSAERTARGAIEEGLGHRLTEKQWAEHRRKLVEFVQTLARWDREQPSVSSTDSDRRP